MKVTPSYDNVPQTGGVVRLRYDGEYRHFTVEKVGFLAEKSIRPEHKTIGRNAGDPYLVGKMMDPQTGEFTGQYRTIYWLESDNVTLF